MRRGEKPVFMSKGNLDNFFLVIIMLNGNCYFQLIEKPRIWLKNSRNLRRVEGLASTLRSTGKREFTKTGRSTKCSELYLRYCPYFNSAVNFGNKINKYINLT